MTNEQIAEIALSHGLNDYINEADAICFARAIISKHGAAMKTIYAIFDEDGNLMHAEEDAANATAHIFDAIDMGIEGAGKWIARLYGPVDTTRDPK